MRAEYNIQGLNPRKNPYTNRYIKRVGVRLEAPNSVTIEAMEEGDRMITDPKAKKFDSVDALLEDLNKE